MIVEAESQSGTLPGVEQWRQLVEDRCGAYFSESRFHVLEGRIRDRVKALGLRGSEAYFELVSAGDEVGRREWEVFLEGVLNGETCFFRNPDVFLTLSNFILPQIAARAGEGQVKLWSAGCSTGEEAYSLAIAAAGCQGLGAGRVLVTGSDANRAALAHARAGCYKSRAIETVPAELRSRYFRPSGTHRREGFEVAPEIRRITMFGHFNLTQPDSYETGQDVIACQNVLIYFRPEWRKRILGWMTERLNPGGFLLLCPGDVVGLTAPGVRRLVAGNSVVFRRA